MRTTKKIPLPVTYEEKTILVCDACGDSVGVVSGTQYNLNWVDVETRVEDNSQGHRDYKTLNDFCPRCWPKIQKAIAVEVKNIKAETMAAVAEAVGVT